VVKEDGTGETYGYGLWVKENEKVLNAATTTATTTATMNHDNNKNSTIKQNFLVN
jgi:hypothetical protein